MHLGGSPQAVRDRQVLEQVPYEHGHMRECNGPYSMHGPACHVAVAIRRGSKLKQMLKLMVAEPRHWLPPWLDAASRVLFQSADAWEEGHVQDCTNQAYASWQDSTSANIADMIS